MYEDGWGEIRAIDDRGVTHRVTYGTQTEHARYWLSRILSAMDGVISHDRDLSNEVTVVAETEDRATCISCACGDAL